MQTTWSNVCTLPVSQHVQKLLLVSGEGLTLAFLVQNDNLESRVCLSVRPEQRSCSFLVDLPGRIATVGRVQVYLRRGQASNSDSPML